LLFVQPRSYNLIAEGVKEPGLKNHRTAIHISIKAGLITHNSRLNMEPVKEFLTHLFSDSTMGWPPEIPGPEAKPYGVLSALNTR
jgi:hypothetical protein